MEEGLPWGEAAAQMRTAVVPFVYGVPWGDEVAWPRRYVPMATAYVGSVLLAVIVYGLGRGRGRERWLLLGLAIIGIMAGASAPGVTEALSWLPLFSLAINRYLVSVAALALALLAALGAETWARAPDRRLGWVGIGRALSLGTLALLLLVSAFFVLRRAHR